MGRKNQTPLLKSTLNWPTVQWTQLKTGGSLSPTLPDLWLIFTHYSEISYFQALFQKTILR